MNWKEEAENLYKSSTLGKRQAQIAILDGEGYTPEEIAHHIKRETECEPQPKTVQSTISKLKKEHKKSIMTQAVLEGGIEKTRIPMMLPNEHKGDNVTVHAYLGEIGCGKTVTAQKHTLRLQDAEGVDNIVVVDIFDEEGWQSLEKHSEIVERITMKQEANYSPPVDEIYTRLNELEKHEHTVLFVDQAHYFLREDSEFIETIQEEYHNISLRIISQRGNELPDGFQGDRLHIHRVTGENDILKIVEKVEEKSIQQFERPLTETVTGLTPGRWGESTDVLTIVSETGESSLRTNTLTEEEKQLLIEPTNNFD